MEGKYWMSWEVRSCFSGFYYRVVSRIRRLGYLFYQHVVKIRLEVSGVRFRVSAVRKYQITNYKYQTNHNYRKSKSQTWRVSKKSEIFNTSFRRRPETCNFSILWIPDQARHDKLGTLRPSNLIVQRKDCNRCALSKMVCRIRARLFRRYT
jgi:hypothetical protein